MKFITAAGRPCLIILLCFFFFFLLKIYVGAGILSLAAGQAKGTGWFPAIAISIALGLISGRTFCMVGEACDMLGEGDFKVSDTVACL